MLANDADFPELSPKACRAVQCWGKSKTFGRCRNDLRDAAMLGATAEDRTE